MEQQMTFEAAMARLEETVRRLEDGGVPLDQMIALYEEGVRLTALCARILDGYEEKLVRLSPREED